MSHIYIYNNNNNRTIAGSHVIPSLIHHNIWNFSSNLKVNIYIAESSNVTESDPSFQKPENSQKTPSVVFMRYS